MNAMNPKTEAHAAVESPGKPSVFELLDMTEAELYQHVPSEERIERERMMRFFVSTIEDSEGGPQLCDALEALRENGTLKMLFGRRIAKLWDPERGKEDPLFHPERYVWLHTLMVCSFLPPNASLRLKLGALFHDVDKPQTMRTFESPEGLRVSQIGHEGSGARTFREFLGERIRLYSQEKVTAQDIDDVAHIIERHGDMHNISNRNRIPEAGLATTLRQRVIGELVLIQFADSMGCGLSKEKRLSYLQAEYIEKEMQERGLYTPKNEELREVFAWILSQIELLRTSEDKLGHERWPV